MIIEINKYGRAWLNIKCQKHRLDGPAVEWDGNESWYKDGFHHRVDGPAVIMDNGDEFWRLNGKEHRLNGPAREYANGQKEWYQYGNLHRLDGPAIIYPNTSTGAECNEALNSNEVWYTKGNKVWSINDLKLKEEKFNNWVERIRAAKRPTFKYSQ